MPSKTDKYQSEANNDVLSRLKDPNCDGSHRLLEPIVLTNFSGAGKGFPLIERAITSKLPPYDSLVRWSR